MDVLIVNFNVIYIAMIVIMVNANHVNKDIISIKRKTIVLAFAEMVFLLMMNNVMMVTIFQMMVVLIVILNVISNALLVLTVTVMSVREQVGN